jgi:hypothetical protein
VSEHGWPGWADEPAGPGPEHPDPHDGDQPGDELRSPDWAGDEAWDPAQDTPDGDPAAAAVSYDDAPAGYADDTADASPGAPGADDGAPYPQGVDGGPLGPVGADPDAVAEPGADPDPPFPPAVDVGELPEPVDGFPWIDTGTLGVVAADMIAEAAGGPYPAVDPADLAAYAQEDLPPAVDPWAALAASDDPATSTLARFWAQEQ